MFQRFPARFSRAENNREPGREWLKGLDAEDRRTIGEDIEDVEFSWPLGMPLVRSARTRTLGGSRRFAWRPDCEANESRLPQEGIYEEVTATAIKRVLPRQLEAAMKEGRLSKAEMARRMRTGRAALDRLLDPDYKAKSALNWSTMSRQAMDTVEPLALHIRPRFATNRFDSLC